MNIVINIYSMCPRACVCVDMRVCVRKVNNILTLLYYFSNIINNVYNIGAFRPLKPGPFTGLRAHTIPWNKYTLKLNLKLGTSYVTVPNVGHVQLCKTEDIMTPPQSPMNNWPWFSRPNEFNQRIFNKVSDTEL